MAIKKILVTGGTGLVGKALCNLLASKGYEVSILSRSKNPDSKYPTFTWNYKSAFIEDGAFESVDAIIHLAGAGVADKRWSAKRKTELLESRTETSNLLYNKLKSETNQVTTIVCASAIGIYGIANSSKMMTEDSPKGTDFLADVTNKWEASSSAFKKLDIRLVQMRIGVVLSNADGALVKILEPPICAPLGKGNQYMSWIHIDDVCGMFLWALQNESAIGAFNVVGPLPITNREFTQKAAKAFKKLYIPLPVPKVLLQILLGQMAEIVLGGSKISCEKIEAAGYQLKFRDFEEAVKDLKIQKSIS